jgi:cytoskeleton protein RodZ
MESIGEKFKKFREEKGYSVEQVARETHIAKRFIIGMETEDFSIFPGDTYLIGFLRNYADFLNIDPDEILTLYRNLKIQEQPAPIDELLEKKNKGGGAKAFLIIIIIAAALTGGFFIFRDRLFTGEPAADKTKLEKPETAADTDGTAVEYPLADEILEQKFNKGDSILVMIKTQSYKVVIKSLTDRAVLEIPDGEVELKVGDEQIVDLNGDGTADIKLLLRMIQEGSAGKTAVLRFDKGIESPSDPAGDRSEADIEDAPAAESSETPGVGITSEPSRVIQSIVILESQNKELFTIEIEFKNYCLFRYNIDETTEEERYFRRGETFRSTARDRIQLWASNAGSVAARIAGREIDLGEPGEVATYQIQWTKDERSEQFRLELVPVY